MTDVARAVDRIRRWGEARDWRGYDPYDALNSPLAPALTLGTPLGQRLLLQAVKLSPVNLRPALRIRPEWNAKAVGIVASAYARLWGATGDDQARAQAERWLQWLVDHHVGGADGMAWGYHFDVQTRFFRYPRHSANTIATSFAAQAFLDACELLPAGGWDGPARESSRFLTTRMLHPSGRFFRYLPHSDELIHNANLLACAVLARTAGVAGATELAGVAAEPIETSLAAQRPDGAWPYAETPGEEWVDNFHTGYVLESLALCLEIAPHAAAHLDRGVDFWERRLFLADGTPKYFEHRESPLDAHNYVQAIETWLSVVDRHPRALDWAQRLAAQLCERMLDPAGFVHFQRRRYWTSRVPLIRWTTAPAFRALARLMLADARSAPPGPASAVAAGERSAS
jgi:hypothetical protein